MSEDLEQDPFATFHGNWVKRNQENLDRVLDENMFIHCLQEQWADSEDIEYIIGLGERRNPKKIAATAVEIFQHYLEMGFIPPPEILLTISDMFKTYFASDGALSLEDVFFGKVKRGVGNYAARKDSDRLYRDFNFFLSFKKFSFADQSMTKKAELFFLDREKDRERLFAIVNVTYKQSELPDIDNFLRQYRRWKKRKSLERKRDS